jgi:hypothetical protein
MRSMLTDHQDDSQCPGLRLRPRRNALRGLHRDYSPSRGRSDAALSQALAVRTVDSEATVQVIRDQCLSHVSTLYSLDINARNCPKRLQWHDHFPPRGQVDDSSSAHCDVDTGYSFRLQYIANYLFLQIFSSAH